MRFGYALRPARRQVGLIVLKTDETIEREFRLWMPETVDLLVSRVESGASVTPESLRAMEARLTGAAALFPDGADLAAAGYGCTSASAEIGAARVAELVRAGVKARKVTDPATALITACRALRVRRLGLLTPYVEEVSAQLKAVLEAAGISVPVLGSFEEAEEARVVRIAPASTAEAARALAAEGGIEALFLSCTNLPTLEIIGPLGAELGMPVLSSNLVLAWHLCRLGGVEPVPEVARAVPG